jgi:predicted RNA-binding protein with PIN domain
VDGSAPGSVVVVDAMNVIGSRPDGWWRDRAAAQRRLRDELVTLAGPGVEVVAVFEGASVADLTEESAGGPGSVTVRWARRRGRDAADDRIVEEVDAARLDGRTVTVVTADRGLRDRVRPLGAHVVGPSSLARAVAATPGTEAARGGAGDAVPAE